MLSSASVLAQTPAGNDNEPAASNAENEAGSTTPLPTRRGGSETGNAERRPGDPPARNNTAPRWHSLLPGMFR
ncbi:hypothetical protein EBB59_05815 [Lysobacter pythonis]|uniref:Uncharacterized protein n=2 Tax=Solilutibacter pythonis TaxID=2483112 RepID=A0A3M2I2G8_9GAMM|nr:hypothetical protein EBB59_05815 [Lysobacter pythonis]